MSLIVMLKIFNSAVKAKACTVYLQGQGHKNWPRAPRGQDLASRTTSLVSVG